MCTEDQLELPDAWFMAHCCVRLTSLHGEDDAHWDTLKRSPPAEQEHDASEWWRFAYFELQLAEILAWSKREMTTAEMTVKRKSCRKHQRCPQAQMQRADRKQCPPMWSRYFWHRRSLSAVKTAEAKLNAPTAARTRGHTIQAVQHKCDNNRWTIPVKEPRGDQGDMFSSF